jgi:hypothetical protein
MADDNDEVLDAVPDTTDVEANIHDIQQQEATALDRGDFAAAHDLATQSDFLVATADTPVDGELANEVSHESLDTDWASWNQSTADANAQSAEQYAAAGDADHAAQYEAIADDHAATADDYAQSADSEIHDDSTATE